MVLSRSSCPGPDGVFCVCICVSLNWFSYCEYYIDIESKLKRIEEDPEGSGTSHLYNCMKGVSSLANRAFEPLFERQVGKI